MGDMGSIGKLLYYWNPNHNPRSLVEKVDFVSCAGYLGGGDEREKLGLTGGPQLVVTNLGVLDFEPETKRMRTQVGPPRRHRREVQDATGFELLMPDGDVPTTPTPTAEQVRLIREEIDPDDMRKREFRTAVGASMDIELGVPGQIMPPGGPRHRERQAQRGRRVRLGVVAVATSWAGIPRSSGPRTSRRWRRCRTTRTSTSTRS